MSVFVRQISVEDRVGLAVYARVVDGARADGLTPAHAADDLAGHAERWPWLWDEIYALRAMDDVWRNVNGHAQGESTSAKAIATALPQRQPDLFAGDAGELQQDTNA